MDGKSLGQKVVPGLDVDHDLRERVRRHREMAWRCGLDQQSRAEVIGRRRHTTPIYPEALEIEVLQVLEVLARAGQFVFRLLVLYVTGFFGQIGNCRQELPEVE